jgi:hypothetical protein
VLSHLHLGVAILLAAVCGGLITVLVGIARMFRLRRAAKRISRRLPHGASGGLTDLGGHHVGVCVRDHVIAVDGDQLGAR